jgi:hypothetical protein
MNKIKIVLKTIGNVLSKKNYAVIFLITGLFFVIFFVSIPIFAIPGNSLKFQMGVYTPLNYLAIFFFSVLVGLMASMRTYNYKMKKSLRKVSGGVFGGFFGFIGGFFGTATCPACVAAIFGFLGTGATLFLIERQLYVMAVSAIFLLLSIYLTSMSIEKKCENCS